MKKMKLTEKNILAWVSEKFPQVSVLGGDSKGRHSTLLLSCQKHGAYKRTLKHLRQLPEEPCPSCAKEVKLEAVRADFVIRAEKSLGEGFKVKPETFTSTSKPVIIVCPKHGEQTVIAGSILYRGSGCVKCFRERRAKADTLPFEDFVNKATKVHQGKYTYIEEGYAGISKQVSVVCSVHGVFVTTGSDHVNSKSGCPSCGLTAISESKITPFVEFLDRAKSVHGDRYTYVESSYTKISDPVTIVCSIHGEFSQRAISHTYRGFGCPQCSRESLGNSLVIPFTEFLRRAQEIFGDKFSYSEASYTRMTAPVEITCPLHGTFSQTATAHLSSIYGCSSCAIQQRAESQKISFEQFLAQAQKVHRNKFRYLPYTFKGAKHTMTIVCPTHGEFQQVAGSHSQVGQGCPSCYDDIRGKTLRLPFKDFVKNARKVHGDRYSYDEATYVMASTPTAITCSVHGVFSQSARDHVNSRHGCPKCSGNVSKGETELFEFIQSLGVTAIQSYKYQGTREFDIYCPDQNLAVEFDGLIWHSTRYRTRVQQLQKRRDADALGVTLIRVFQDEWGNRREQVKSLIARRLGVAQDQKVYARKCEVVQVENQAAREFYESYHIQGWRMNGINYGLEHQEELVAVMSFSSNRSARKASEDGLFELVRFATSCSVVGGASKLLKAFIREHNPKTVVSYSDRRVFSGGMYEALGFELDAEVPPSYEYFKSGALERQHKSRFQHSKLPSVLGDLYNPDLSERENCELGGYYQVYDDGKLRWKLNLQ